jgi:hypothetical protein
VPAQAQATRVGVSGGANIAEINVSGDESLNVVLRSKSEPVGGVSLALDAAGPSSLEIDAFYSVKGSKLKGSGGGETRIRLTYLEVPVMLRYAGPENSTGKLHVFAGVYGGYLFHATSQISRPTEGSRVDVKDAFKSFDFGWVAGVGVSVRKIRLDLRYSGGVTDLAAQEHLGGIVPAADPTEPLKFRNRAFGVLLTFGL